MKRLFSKILLIILLPALLTFGLSQYVPVPVFQIQKANAAFAAFRTLTAKAGVSSGSVTSYLFDGTEDRLDIADSASWDLFGSAVTDRTISAFVRLDSAAASSQLIVGQSESTADRWAFYHSASSGLTALLRTGNLNTVILSDGSVTISDTNIHHVAFCKKSAEYGLYFDGAQVAYVSDSSTDTFAASLFIGGSSETADWSGNIDEVLIEHDDTFGAVPVVGLTDTITVPTVEHTSNSNVKLLIHCNEDIDTGTTGSGATFTESGNDSVTVTEVNEAIRDTTNGKF